MDLNGYNTVLTIAIGAISGVLGIFLKIVREIKKSKDEDAVKVLAQAKTHANEVKLRLESRINILESELSNLKNSFVRDIENLKDNHALELKNLSERVDLLREDLRHQHSNILDLLTRLMDKN